MYLAQTTAAAHPQFAPVDTATLVAALPGCWMLQPGRAVSLRASQAGTVCVASGRVWLTFDGAATDMNVRAGDYFLAGGESLPLAAGQSLVMESFAPGYVDPAYFSWEPALQRQAAPGWFSGHAQPLLDLRAALVLVAAAVGRLVRSLVGGLAVCGFAGIVTALFLIAVLARGFWAVWAFNAQSSANRPHGCMTAGDSMASSGAL
jgi:hypothetical protein